MSESTKDEADAKVLLNTRIPITWVFAAMVPLIWSAVKLNYTVESLVKVTSQLTTAITSLNSEREQASREREQLRSQVAMLEYQFQQVQAELKDSRDGTK